MAVPIPDLDNRTFEQLLKESRRSIPHYAPEWTNHNPADPGITLIELFAWLAEITSYRINLVTEEHLLKYLKLLGIRPRGSQSAITDLSFETEEDIENDILLEKGSVFSAEQDGEIIDFELLENISITPITLEKIIVNEMAVDLPQPSFSNSSNENKLLQPSSTDSLGNRESLILAEVLEVHAENKKTEVSQDKYSSQATNSRSTEKNSVIKYRYGHFDRFNESSTKDLFFAPFGLDTKKGSVLYLGFNLNYRKSEEEYENAKIPESLNFMCYIYEKDLIEPGKHGNEEGYKFENAVLRWEISTSSDGKQWKEVNPIDGTLNFMKNGSFLFTDLEDWICSSINFWNSESGRESKKPIEKYFWLRCTLLKSEYEYPPRIESICLNTASVIQKKTLRDLMLGKSNGLPSQVFKLPESPVLRGSLKLILSGEKWMEIEDFDGSGPESPHFTLKNLVGEIRFGDGLRGKIPPKDIEIRIIEYETGKGALGNLPAYSTWEIKEKNIRGLRKIVNHKPATGGKNEESINQTFERFIRDLRVPYRAVTSEDFEYIAKETPGLRVAQAKAIPNFNPFSNTEEPGAVTVVVVPFSPFNTYKTPPEPSKGFRKLVARHLEKHRLLGTHVYVVSPEYVRVKTQVTLMISKGFSEGKIKNDVLSSLYLFLHPTKGGINGKGWPVGKPVYRSEIYKLIMKTEGVGFVEKIEICAQEYAKLDENGDLRLASRIATVYSGEHSVEVLRYSGKPI